MFVFVSMESYVCEDYRYIYLFYFIVKKYLKFFFLKNKEYICINNFLMLKQVDGIVY